jgi:hypothetical protein
MSTPVRLMVCVALLLVTLGDAAAQKRGMGGGGLRQTCMQQTSEAHPLGTSPECQRFNARMGQCQTYIRGNARNSQALAGMGQLRR